MTIPDRSTTTTAPQATDPLNRLRRIVTGQVHRPCDVDWDRARTPWLVNVQQTPLAVVDVADTNDVQAAVCWAFENGRQVTAQPVGHGAYDSLDQVLLLRTNALNSIEVDRAAGTATVGAGVTVGALLDALDGTGWTFLAGSNTDPTVVGMTITGGLSWFGRAYGLAANRILSAELIDGTGRRRRVTPADTDLFWALRGGGGGFGIITALQIQLVPGRSLYGGMLLWPLERMPLVLRTFRQITAGAPEQLTLWYMTLRFPPQPEVPEALRGRAFASVAVAHLGGADHARQLLQPLRTVPGILLDSMEMMQMRDLGNVTAEPTTPTPMMGHSVLLDDLDDVVIERLTDAAGAGSDSPLMMLQIRHLGGAFRRQLPGAGAAGHIDEPYIMFAMGIPATAALTGELAASFGRVDEAVAGHTTGLPYPQPERTVTSAT